MRILCLNGWGGKLHDVLIPYVQSVDPDVLCLQEVVHSPQTNKDWLTYRDGTHVLPQRANFFNDVSIALPGHRASFCPASEGILYDDAKIIPSQWGLASFWRKSLTAIGQFQGFIHKDYSPDGYGEHPRSRSIHILRLYDHDRGTFVTIANVHGLRDLNGKGDTPARAAQARKLLSHVSAVAGSNDEIIICGDFNVEPESETLRLIKSAGFVELVTSGGFQGTRTSHYQKPGKFADYVFVNDLVRPKSFSVIYSPEVSDHSPILLDI